MPHSAIPAGRPLDSLDRVRARTKMMVEDYSTSGAATPTRPVFRTQYSVADANGAPSPNAKILLWASEAMTIEVGGRTFNLPTAPDTAPSFPTDALGMLSLTYSADGISSPFLYARTDFVDQFATIPDFEVLARLSSVDGPALAPDQARNYAGTPILLEKYQDEDSRTAIAGAIRNTIGNSTGSNQALAAFLAGAHQPQVAAVSSRGVSPNDVLHWTLDIGDTAVFMPSETEVFTAQLAMAQGALSLLGGFKEFLRDVVNGVKRAAKAVARWAKDAVDFIVQTAEGYYQFTLRLLEDAVKVVKGIFRSIVNEIEAVIEWLSFLFGWDDILRTQDAIATFATQTIQTVRNALDQQIAAGARGVHAFFQAREEDVESLLATFRAQNTESFGVQTRGAAAENPLAAGGQDSSVQTMWLLGRAMAIGSPAAAPLPASPAGSPVGEALGKLTAFFETARAQVAANPATAGLEAQFQTTLGDFSRLVNAFGDIRSLSIDELLKVVADLAVLALKAADFVIEGFLTLVRDVIDAVLGALTAPPPVAVPFVSDLYRALTKKELTLVGVGALLVAVPTTILWKAINGTPPVTEAMAPLAALTVPGWVMVALTSTLVIKAIASAVIDTGLLSDVGPAPLIFSGGLSFVLWGLKVGLLIMASLPQGPTDADQLIFFATMLPLLVWVALLFVPQEARSTYLMTAGPFVATGLGFFLLIVHGALAISVGGRYAKSAPANIASDLPLAAKALGRLGVNGTTAVVTIDLLGYVLSAVILRLQWAGRGGSLLAVPAA